MNGVEPYNRSLLHRSFFPFFLFVVILLFPGVGQTGPKVEYDRGLKGKERHFVSAESCTHTPCIITEWGAISLPKGVDKTHQIQLGAMHRGLFSSIALFQESTTFEQKLSERVLVKKPNRKIVNLERLIGTGKTSTIYIYGLLLQHELDEGDLIAVSLASLKNRQEVQDYYFRYHHEGAKLDIDIAFVQPISYFTPNPGNVVQAAFSTAALSFSIARALDPEKHYNLPSKMVRAVRFNLFTGVLLRRDIEPFNGDLVTKDLIDGFAGIGVTFFDFLAMGYGASLVRTPRTTFPFFGLELRHLAEFIRGLKADTHTRWQGYLKEEMAKSSAPVSSDSSRR